MGQIKISELTTEEQLQLELSRRSLRTCSRDELLAIADQLLWNYWHRERVVKGLSDRVLELEMELTKDFAVTEEHHQWAKDLFKPE